MRGAALYGILGPLRIDGDHGGVLLRSPLQRLLFAVLLVEVNRTVSADRLADELWGDRPPGDARAALRTQVSRLRRSLPEGTPLVTDAAGYRLIAHRDELDAVRFEDLLAAAGQTSGADALELVDDALELWRGVPLEEFIDRPFAQIEARRLEELHDGARERRAALLLAAGRPADAAAEAESLLAEHPEREHARALLMEALYHQGRHTSALDVYQSWRRQLAEEHGLEPSPTLQQIEQRILRHTVTATSHAPPDPDARVAVPRPVSSFIGRDTDLHGVGEILGYSRLVTLWGPGGVGKTRLALEVAAHVASDYPDGVHVCDLTVLSSGAPVARALANTLGVHEQSGRRLEAQLVDRLADQRTLVILDSCEHVLAQAAQLARHLIQSTAGIDVLATSRERLGVDAEQLWEVAPLAAGGPDSPAVALFVDRARSSNQSFVANPEDLEAIARICRRLDGLPLGVELAAARTRGLALTDLLRALEQRSEILTAGAGSPRRHRSLRAVIDWSYTQLGPLEQSVFDRLSVFRGHFDLDAAIAIAAPNIERDAVVPAVLRLLECALLVAHDDAGRRRYSMLDTVRHYGLEHLEAQQALADVRDRHARWALTEAERAAPCLATAGEAESAAAIERCIDELRAAHTWLVGQDLEAALRLSAALRPYAIWRGHSEILRWAEVAAAAATSSGANHALLPEVLLAASTGAWQRGDVEAATTAADAASRAAGGMGDAAARAALEASADVAFLVGDLERAVASFTEAYALAVAAEDLLQAVWDLGSAAIAVGYGGDIERALEIAEQVVSTSDASGSPSAAAFGHFVLGEILTGVESNTAEAHLRRAVELATTVDSRFVVGLAEVSLAASRTRQEDVPNALSYCESAVRRWHAAGAWTPLWVTLRTVIVLLMRAGSLDDAAILYAAAASPSSTRVAPYGADESMLREAAEELGRRLGDEELARLQDAGSAMGPDDAVHFALDALSRAGHRAVPDGDRSDR